MKRLLALTILLLGMATPVFADGMQQVVSSTTTNPRWTVTVFNDSGSALTSSSVVVWDNDDTEFDRSGYPYVTTTTSADSPWTAGVTLTPSCPDQGLCEIVVYGPAQTLVAYSTDNAAEDTLVGTTTVAGQAGDYGTGANTCALGMDMEDLGAVSDCELHWVFVNVNCN